MSTDDPDPEDTLTRTTRAVLGPDAVPAESWDELWEREEAERVKAAIASASPVERFMSDFASMTDQERRFQDHLLGLVESVMLDHEPDQALPFAKSPTPCVEIAIEVDGVEAHFPIREIGVLARLHRGMRMRDGREWTIHQVIYAPGLQADVLTEAARDLGVSAALSWLASQLPPPPF